ncbi:hypothetical protein CERSUDRAFT_122642 [Gelatoporia subvermispora B]|uniref:DUF6533 domain-containing protein n=1 Tax=Ceriporiopsis subvermispora (strain B) TaxID=914234 RepID=M2RK53_CERS8|nr:hypothetical protein CERSUDRAFT_122642 [Gelatoporia subvermispora B]
MSPHHEQTNVGFALQSTWIPEWSVRNCQVNQTPVQPHRIANEHRSASNPPGPRFSTATQVDMTDFIATFKIVRLHRAVIVVSLTQLYFDYLLTFFTEVERFWMRGISWISVLYAANRYITLLGSIPIAIEYFGIIPQPTYHQYAAVGTQALVAVLLTLRTYALYKRSKVVLSMILFIFALSLGVTLWIILSEKSLTGSDRVLRGVGCDLSLSKAQAAHLAASWGTMLAFDVLIFVLTLLETIKNGMLLKGSLSHIMLRDGAIYFGVIVFMNIVNILAFLSLMLLQLPTRNKDELRGMCTTLTNAIASTLVSRLMLNLRDPKQGQTPLGFLASFSVQLSTTATQTTAIEEGFRVSESNLNSAVLSLPDTLACTNE